jgi:hypothetical protein
MMRRVFWTYQVKSIDKLKDNGWLFGLTWGNINIKKYLRGLAD